jgi:CHC2 zinc finger
VIDLSIFQVEPDKDAVRAALPLAYVCSELGIYVDATGAALCPFHPDTDPSFHLWQGETGERWGCWPCGGIHGDLYDLIQRVESLTFPQALDRAREMLSTLPYGYSPPRIAQARRSGDPSVWYPFVSEALQRAAARPNWPVSFRSWGVGVGPNDELVLPHWNAQGVLTGCKMRAGGLKYSLEPSTYPDLYGAWFARTGNCVLLTEGESDAITASESAAREGITLDVRALPSGVRFPMPSWVAYLRQWDAIYVALDNDAASAPKTVAWLDALAPVGYPVNLPWETDLRETLGSGTTLRDILNLPVPS